MRRMIYTLPLALLLSLTSCGAKNDPAPTPAASDKAYVGTVKLIDEFGVALADASGV